MAELKNAALAGDFLFDTVIYASAGINYGGVPALAQYTIYDAPNPAFITPRINIAPLANLGSAPGPFSTRTCRSTDTSASLADAVLFR